MPTETREEIAEIVEKAKALIAAHERRSPTSENATLGETDALFNLRWTLKSSEKGAEWSTKR